MPDYPDSVIRIKGLSVLGWGEGAIYMPGTIVP